MIVEKVPAGALRRAGIEQNDRLLAWRRRHGSDGGAAGPLESPLDLWSVEHEQSGPGNFSEDPPIGRTR